MNPKPLFARALAAALVVMFATQISYAERFHKSNDGCSGAL